MKKTEKMNRWIQNAEEKIFNVLLWFEFFFWKSNENETIRCLFVCLQSDEMKWNNIFVLLFKSDRFFVSLSGKRKIFIIHLDNLTNNRTKIKFESRWRRKRKIIETGNIKTILEHESQNKQTDKKSRKSRNVHRSINRNDHLMFQKQQQLNPENKQQKKTFFQKWMEPKMNSKRKKILKLSICLSGII